MRRSFLFAFITGFGGGIAAAELQLPFAIAAVSFAVFGFLITGKRTRLAAIFLLAGSLGYGRTLLADKSLTAFAPYDGRTAVVEGEMIEVPIAKNGRSQAIVRSLYIDGRYVAGNLSAFFPSMIDDAPGQKVSLRCQLQALPAANRGRLQAQGEVGICQVMDVLSMRHVVSWRSILVRIREQAAALIASQFNEPQASLLAGIVFGAQQNMPSELRQAFQATGTTHIIALSGFNVTIIVTSMMTLLVRLIGRRWAWIPALVGVGLFVVMTGAASSVVRAAIMAMIVHLGLFLGRPLNVVRLLAYTFLGMVMANPFVFLHDLGFQLSFLATVGLVGVAPLMQPRLSWLTERWGMRANLATTLGAIIVTEPLLLFRFGRLSLIAPLVNLAVLPFIPLSMALGGLCLGLGFLSERLAGTVVPVTDIVLRGVIGVIVGAAHLPFAMTYVSWLPAAATSAAIVWLITYLYRHASPERL